MKHTRWITAAALLLAGSAPATLPADQLEAAIYAEETKGDLQEAARQYEQILRGIDVNREIAATAQGRLARCLLKLGKTEDAVRAFQILQMDYGDVDAGVQVASQEFAHFFRQRLTKNDANDWIYFDSRETPTGPRLLLKTAGAGEPVELKAAEDTLLIQYLSDSAYGAHQQLGVALDDQNRALIRFDLPDSIAPEQLERAELVLAPHAPKQPPQDVFDVAVQAVSGPWSETTTTWLNQPRVAPEEATAFVVFPGEGASTEQRIDVTALVRIWLAGERPNHGFSLRTGSAVYGPLPLDIRSTRAPFPTAWLEEMSVDDLWHRMVYGEIGQPHMAGLWALLRKGENDVVAKSGIVARAAATLADSEADGFERWLCAFLISGSGGAAHAPALLDALDDPADGVRAGVWIALGALGRNITASESILPKLEAAKALETNKRVLAAADKAMAGEYAWHLEAEPVEAGEAAALEAGWALAGNAPDKYSMKREGERGGVPTYAVESRTGDIGEKEFGTMLRTMDAAPYRGKRLRLHADIKPENVAGWAGLWMRIDDVEKKPRGFDNMEQRPIMGTGDWQGYQVVLDVPESAASITYGLLVRGTGTLQLSEPRVEIVGDDVAVTSTP